MGAGAAVNLLNIDTLKAELGNEEETGLMPLLFLAHGSPMNALADNEFTQSLKALGKTLPKPKVIITVSAHWLTRGTFVTAKKFPQTIHDFGGFPEPLFKVKYPAPGSPEMAEMVTTITKDINIGMDYDWGLDHGTWSVLKHLYPEADVPVIQLSIDYYKPVQYHYELAAQLKGLRKKGVLIVGSGNITHNFNHMDWNTNAKPYDWVLEFDNRVKEYVKNGDHNPLINYQKLPNANLAIPTNDHYLPLIYTLGLQYPNEMVTFPYEGIQNAGFSMRCIKIG